MKIKISHCSESCYWYAAHIGEVLSVENFNNELYKTVYTETIYTVYTIANDHFPHFILKKDCEIIEDEPKTIKLFNRYDILKANG